MTINTVKKWARILARAHINAFIVGGHGIGKTSAIYQLYLELAKEAGKQDLPEIFVNTRDGDIKIDALSISSIDGKVLSRKYQDPDAFGFWSVSAANVTMEEMIGMPDIEDRGAIYRQVWLETMHAASRMSEGGDLNINAHKSLFKYACEELGVDETDKNRKILRYMRMHSLLPDPGHRGGGIWCIDELNLGFPEVEKMFMQMLLEGRFLDYILPPNVWVVTTMNPPGSAYPGARELALPTVDRGAMITVKSELSEWSTWAARRGLSEQSRMFAEKNDRILNIIEDDLQLDTFDNPGTYRSIELADRAFAVMTDEEVKNVGMVVSRSILGKNAGSLYWKTYTESTTQPLSLKEVINDYGWYTEMTREQEKDYKNWKVSKPRARLAAMVRKSNVQAELVRCTLTEIEQWFEAKGKELTERGSTRYDHRHTREEHGHILNALLFLHDIPVDMTRHFINERIVHLYETVLYWTGHYPVIIAIHERCNTEFKEAGGEDKD